MKSRLRRLFKTDLINVVKATNKLNRFLLFSFVISCLCLYGCKKTHQVGSDACLPGHVLIVPMRESSKPNQRLLIRTNNKDLNYLKYLGNNSEHYNRYGFAMDSFDLESGALHFITVDALYYSRIKEYILSHNTHKKNAILLDAYNSVKIFLEDKCDSVAYIVEKTDTGFFTQLFDTSKTFENKDLLNSLDYFKNIQEADPNDKYQIK